MDEYNRGMGYNLVDSAREAFSLGNMVKRVVLFLVFGFLLGLKYLVQNLDEVGRQGGGFLAYMGALTDAQLQGVSVALGSLWKVIINPLAYISSHSWGSIIFCVFSLIFLMMFFYQPISIIINVFDGKRGHTTGVLLRSAITLLVIIISSSLVFYGIGGETVTSDLNDATDSTNTTMETNETTDSESNGTEIDMKNSSSVISLV